MPAGRYPRWTEEEKREMDAHRKLWPKQLNSGLSVTQVFMIIEEMLGKSKKDLPNVGFYTIWSKFLRLSGEPSNRLLYSKLAQGYIGPLIVNDADELAVEELPNGVHPMELGKRFRLLRGAFESRRLNRSYTSIDRWEHMSEGARAADAYAAQEIFDLGYQLGLSQATREFPKLPHVPDKTYCLCDNCLREIGRDGVIRQARVILVQPKN